MTHKQLNEEIEKIVNDIQSWKYYADNKAKPLANQRDIAKQAILNLITREVREGKIEENDYTLRAWIEKKSNDDFANRMSERIMELSNIKGGKV